MNSFIGHLSPNVKDDDARLQSNFCWHLNGFDSMAAVKKRVAELKVVNPNLVIGCHRSACTFLPGSMDFPGHPKHIDLEKVADCWILTNTDGSVCYWKRDNRTIDLNRPYADLTQSYARSQIIYAAINVAVELGMGAVAWDNCYYQHPLGKLSREQVTQCFISFIRMARHECSVKGLKLIINVSCSVDRIPAMLEAYAPRVDGIMLEQSFHPYITSDPVLWNKEKAAYRYALEMGKCLYLWKEDVFCAIGWLKELMQEFPNQIYFAKLTGWNNDRWFYYGEEK